MITASEARDIYYSSETRHDNEFKRVDAMIREAAKELKWNVRYHPSDSVENDIEFYDSLVDKLEKAGFIVDMPYRGFYNVERDLYISWKE